MNPINFAIYINNVIKNLNVNPENVYGNTNNLDARLTFLLKYVTENVKGPEKHFILYDLAEHFEQFVDSLYNDAVGSFYILNDEKLYIQIPLMYYKIMIKTCKDANSAF